jgi:hypothetical protein
MLLYAVIHTRIDIAFTVNMLSRFCNDPGTKHINAVKHLVKYVNGTLDHVIVFYKRLFPEQSGPCDHLHFNVSCYTDADLAGNPDTRHSQTGYILMIGRSVIAWNSTGQGSLSSSTAESEIKSVRHCLIDILVIVKLILSHMGFPQYDSPTYNDNKAVKDVSDRDEITRGLRHIELAYHIVITARERGVITIVHIPSADNVADILTKPVSAAVFNYLVPSIIMHRDLVQK